MIFSQQNAFGLLIQNSENTVVYPEIKKSWAKLDTHKAEIALKKIADSGGAEIFALVPFPPESFLG